jgi:hypothetical protein
MPRYARGKHAVLISDRSGWRIKYKDARTEWTGARVSKQEWEEKQPQLDPQKYLRKASAQGDVLYDPRPDDDSVPTTVRLGPLFGKWSGQAAMNMGMINFSQAEEPAGFSMAAELGSLKISIVAKVTMDAIGTATQGTINISETEDAEGFELTPSQGQVTLPVVITQTLSATATQGTVGIGTTEDAEGLSATTSMGTVTISLFAQPSGLTLTPSQGSVMIPGIEVPDGMYVTATQGTVQIAGIEAPDGMYVTATQGTVTPVEVTVVAPSGLTMTAYQGTIGVTSPSWGNFTWGHDTWGQ